MIFKTIILDKYSTKINSRLYINIVQFHLKSTKGKSIIFLVDFFHFPILNLLYYLNF